jgi:hypothetical protein
MEKLNLGTFKNSPEWREMQRNIQDKRRKLKQLHDGLMRMEKQRNHSVTTLRNKYRQYNETIARLSQEVSKKNRELYLKWANRILLIWKKKQTKLLKEKFERLIPKEPFYIIGANNTRKVYIRPEEARKQAHELVNAIVNTVYFKLKEGIEKYGRLPFGGNRGNWSSLVNKGEMQCADKDCKGWSDIIQYQSLEIITEYIKKDKNAFWMIWRRYEGHIVITEHKGIGEHNWVEFKGKEKKERVIIDPWPSGGRKIYSKEPYEGREGKSREIFPVLTVDKK